MKKNKKLVLILERSGENLSCTTDGDDVVLEGVFTQFGVVNNNDRIYEENEYLPHLKYLQEKINEKRLLGELDHPDKFDISLSRVSHVIEKLTYDKDKRQIRGRVRLLNTPSGKIAKELVEGGVPIGISSRAAGLVESNKKVVIKKIFTYDLVAETGFANAILTRMNESESFKDGKEIELERINESLGINDSNIDIYDVTSKYPDFLETFENEKKDNNNMNNYVTSDQLNKYSIFIKENIESLEKKIGVLDKKITENKNESLDEKFNEFVSKMNEMKNLLESYEERETKTDTEISSLKKYTNYISKKLDESINYSNYLAENMDNSIEYSNYLKEQMEQGISYSEYLKECLEQSVGYSEYLASKVDEGIEYSNYLSGKIDEGINYSNYLGENVNSMVEYADYLGENLEHNINYADYLGKTLNEGLNYSNYLCEKLDSGISYTEYLGEQTQNLSEYTEYMMNESGVSKTKLKEGIIKENVDTKQYSNLSDKVDAILESIKKQTIESKNSQLNETRKEKVSEQLNESNQKNAESAVNGMIGNDSSAKGKWLTEAPEEYKKIWEGLNNEMKEIINAQSKFYRLETPYQIENFWQTRNFSKAKGGSENLNEGLKNPEKEILPELGYSTEYIKSIGDRVGRFNKK